MKRILQVVAAAALALAPAAALAAVDGSHHDMQTFNNSAEKCAYCHAITGLPAYTGYGQTGSFCIAVCHDGATTGLGGATPSAPGKFGDGANDANRWQHQGGTDAIDVVAFTGSHAEDPTLIPGPDQTSAVTGTNWPHVNETTMQCTSCHAVHDGTNPPFLNAALSGTSNAASFCQRCHDGGGAAATQAGRYQDITGMGAHPTEFAYVDGTSAARAAPKLSRAMEIKATTLYTPLKAAYADVAAFNADNTGDAWRTGGHFIGANGLPVTAANSAALAGQQFGCYSCHSAHQNDTTLNTWLGLGDLEYTLSTGDTSNFCTGCHGATATPNNPGSSLYYHPVNEETDSADGINYTHDHAAHGATVDPNIPATGTFPIVVDLTGVAATYTGTNNEIYCTSCHDVHGGVGSQMAIREIDTTVQITNSNDVCFACHKEAMGQPDGATADNYHHPGTTANYVTADGFPATLGWSFAGGYGDLSDGLSCPDCHVFQAEGTTPRRATAHNW